MPGVQKTDAGRSIVFPDGYRVFVPSRHMGKYRPGVGVPKAFRAEVSGGPDLEYALELWLSTVDGQVRCTRFIVKQIDGGPPVTARRIRTIQLELHIRHCIQVAAADVWEIPGMPSAQLIAPLNLTQRQALDRAAAKRGAGRRREAVTDERLRAIAAAWRQYRGTPRALEVAARSLALSRAHFHRLLGEAVERGILPPSEAPRRRGAE